LLPILLVAHLAFCPGGVGQGKVAAFSFPCRRHVQFQPDRQHCPAMGPYLQCWSPYLARVEAMVCVCVCVCVLACCWMYRCDCIFVLGQVWKLSRTRKAVSVLSPDNSGSETGDCCP
jgi:hypothetical protein